MPILSDIVGVISSEYFTGFSRDEGFGLFFRFFLYLNSAILTDVVAFLGGTYTGFGAEI